MPSHLRLQTSAQEPIEVEAVYSQSIRQNKRQKRMSLTQVYGVASTARSKLGREASRADHNLRRLVGHANLLDGLMIELAEAERESASWFDESIRNASQPEEPRKVQWMDQIAEEYEEETAEDSDSESDAGSDIDEEDAEMFNSIPMPKIRSAPITIESAVLDDDEEMDYDEEEYEDELALQRSPSKHSPPELVQDAEDSDSEDEESFPSSPEDIQLHLSEKERTAIVTTSFGLQDYAPQAPIIAAC